MICKLYLIWTISQYPLLPCGTRILTLSTTFLSYFSHVVPTTILSVLPLCLFLTFSFRCVSFTRVGSVCCWPATPTLLSTTSCWSWSVSGSAFYALGRGRRCTLVWYSVKFTSVNKSKSNLFYNSKYKLCHFVDACTILSWEHKSIEYYLSYTLKCQNSSI